MGYGADIVATAEAYMYNYNMANFYTKTVQDFANEQQPDGALTEIAPYTGIADRGYGGESGPLGWQLAFSYVQKKLYQQYGDLSIIEQHYHTLTKQLEYLQTKAQQGLYWWDIGDHEAINRTSDAFAASCFYYHHALLAEEFASLLDMDADAAKYKKLAQEIRRRLLNTFYVKKSGRFDNGTQSAQLFALWYKLGHDDAEIFRWLIKEFEREQWHISTGIFSTMMLFDVLREVDKNDIALKLATQAGFPGWKYMLNNGATTLWESWEQPTSASWNHPMFGSIDAWMYKSLLGITAIAPGFKKIKIKPQPASLNYAEGTYKSIYGEIKSSWKKTNHQFTLTVTIPVNTSAEIWLPATATNSITENGDTDFQKEGISLLRYENGYAVIATGSGTYHFVVN
jgi:alpha-L-rhamnosidase